MALVIGASREGAEIAAQRSLKAARLQAIKAELAKDRDLSIHEIAQDQAVSPRYVQKLFEESGTTFTEFVLALRLEAARAMLVSPRFAHWTVAAISQEAGFGDLSYFNRRFKARYDQTPPMSAHNRPCRGERLLRISPRTVKPLRIATGRLCGRCPDRLQRGGRRSTRHHARAARAPASGAGFLWREALRG
jgi:AraC-like DNA-binding protein